MCCNLLLIGGRTHSVASVQSIALRRPESAKPSLWFSIAHRMHLWARGAEWVWHEIKLEA